MLYRVLESCNLCIRPLYTVSAILDVGPSRTETALTSSQEFRFELTQLRERDGLGVPWRVVHAVADARSNLSLDSHTAGCSERLMREVNTEQQVKSYTALFTPEVGLLTEALQGSLQHTRVF